MSYATAPQTYRRSEILAATPGQLVVLLYDGAGRFLRQAATAMGADEVQRTHDALRRAERIIRYLDSTLDFELGEIPERLHAIYQFCLKQLNDARFGQDAAKVQEVGTMLAELREAWSYAAAEVERG